MTLRDCNYPYCKGTEECHMCTQVFVDEELERIGMGVKGQIDTGWMSTCPSDCLTEIKNDR